MPEGFYIEIMDLIKKYYLENYFQNFEKIHTLIENNKNVVDKRILKVLSKTFKQKRKIQLNLNVLLVTPTIIILIVGPFIFALVLSINKR
jgi:hypothetical protein